MYFDPSDAVQISKLCATKICVCKCVSVCVLRGASSEIYKRVSLSHSEASMSCSHCVELFSSLLSDSSSALPLVRAHFSSLFKCLLRRAKPEMHRRKETVLKPSVRPRYTILQEGQTKREAEGRYKLSCFQHIWISAPALRLTHNQLTLSINCLIWSGRDESQFQSQVLKKKNASLVELWIKDTCKQFQEKLLPFPCLLL